MGKEQSFIVQFVSSKKVYLGALFLLILVVYLFSSSLTLRHLGSQQKAFYQDDAGQTYLYEQDSYHYLYVLNTLISDAQITVDSLHGYFLHIFYKALHIIQPVSSITSMFYFSFLLIIVAGFLMFFLLLRMTSFFPALFGGILFLGLLANSRRILVGFVDTDIYLVIFPVLVFWLLQITCKKQHWTTAAVAAGVAMGVFSATWHGWWIFFALFVVSYWIYLLTSVNKNSWLPRVWSLSLFMGITYVFYLFFRVILKKTTSSWFVPKPYLSVLPLSSTIMVVVGVLVLFVLSLVVRQVNIRRLLIRGHRSSLLVVAFLLTFFLFSFVAATISPNHVEVGPNPYTSIVELQQRSLSVILDRTAGLPFFILALLGLFFLITKDSTNIFVKTTIVLWFFLGLSLSLFAERFLIIFLVPLTLGFTYFFRWLWSWLLGLITSANRTYVRYVLVIFFFVLLSFPLLSAKENVESALPTVNDDLADAFDYIKENTPKNALIYSSWDYGHRIKAMTGRQVLVDGGSQSSAGEYWVSRAFSTDNENLSQGIFHLFGCIGNPHVVWGNINSRKYAQVPEQLEVILPESAGQAYTTLLQWYDSEHAQKIVNQTHCLTSRPAYVFVTDIMLNSATIPKAGLWNVTRGQYFRDAWEAGVIDVNALQSHYGVSLQEAESLHQALVAEDGQQYALDYRPHVVVPCEPQQGIVQCGPLRFNLPGGLVAPLDLGDYINTIEDVRMQDQLRQVMQNETVYLIQKGGKYQIFIVSPELAKSLLINLYFGKEVNHFTNIYQTNRPNPNIFFYAMGDKNSNP